MKTELETELNEQAMIGNPVHLICCNSNSSALCGHICRGKKYPPETAVDCGDCVEQDVERYKVECWANHPKCVAIPPESRKQD